MNRSSAVTSRWRISSRNIRNSVKYFCHPIRHLKKDPDMFTPRTRPPTRPLPSTSSFSASDSARKTSTKNTSSTILLVDDDHSVREGLRRVLQTEGWNVVAAASGEEALEYLLNHQPDLMITDL